MSKWVWDSHGPLLVPVLLSSSKGLAGEVDGGFEESVAPYRKLEVVGDLLCLPSASLSAPGARGGVGDA